MTLPYRSCLCKLSLPCVVFTFVHFKKATKCAIKIKFLLHCETIRCCRILFAGRCSFEFRKLQHRGGEIALHQHGLNLLAWRGKEKKIDSVTIAPKRSPITEILTLWKCLIVFSSITKHSGELTGSPGSRSRPTLERIHFPES